MHVLMFQLTAHLASWGSAAVGECRPTESRPSHSALVGIVGAALGITKIDARQTALAKGYAFATRDDGSVDGVLTDYQTAQTGRGKFRTRAEALAQDSLRTVLSWRDYKMDARATVAMIAQPGAPASLTEVAAALREPVFVLYAGRKSCALSAPPHPLVVDVSSLDEAFLAYDAARVWTPFEGTAGVVACDEAFIGGLVDASRVTQTVMRRDVPVFRLPQKFVMRRENILAA